MALTPEDVLKKSFAPTQFRRGYDEREVDDFLDEVVSELRDLLAQRDDYKRKYEESVKRGGGAVVTQVDDERVAAQAEQIKELERRLEQATAAPAKSGATVKDGPSAAELTRVREEAAKAQQEQTRLREQLEAKDAELAAAREELEQAKQQAAAPADEATKAAGVLAMAQQLHDQLVSQGQAEKVRLVEEGTTRRDTLLTEAKERHESLVAEGTTQRDTLVAEARRKRDEVLSSLEEQRAGLERDIAALRSFEAKYKQQLVGFLEGKLHEAKNTRSLQPKG